jgi:N-acyl homoserine lactone hydrolase
MSASDTTVQKLYLLQLSTTSVPVGSGRTLEMSSGAYLIVTNDGRHILVDTGMPADVPLPPYVPPPQNEKSVLEHLADLKLHPSDIDTVICTHFDIDHCGHHDAFPDAEFVVQRSHLTLARSGVSRYAGARAHWDHPALRYRQIDGDKELLPGITLLETPGHCPGHQSVLVRLPKTGPVLLAIDAVVMQRLFTIERKAWPTDDNETQLRASTQKLLDIVKMEHAALTVFGHDGDQWRSLKKSPAFYD